MTFIALDTLAVVKDLKAAGFTDDQAEAVARVVRRGQDVDLSELATKAGLEKAILETMAGLERMMAKTKAETLKWMLGSMGIQTIVIISAVLAVVRASH